MHDLPEGYGAPKLLRRTERSEVFEATRDTDGLPVILKRYFTDRLDDPRARAAREYATLKRLDVEDVPRALALDRTTQLPTLVMDRLPGQPLAQLMASGPLSVDAWIDVAVQVADKLARIHAAHVIHKDIKPANLLLDRENGRIGICDFGLATHLGEVELRAPAPQAALEGTFFYISPEQTGRMNRSCDFRSDLYSLGATLYHACVGQPPFPVDDLLELVHAHLARTPESPSELRPDVPEAISRMILKLLRKDPSERYQSARGLHADLLLCREQSQTLGRISSELEVGVSELPESPRFTTRLYGRETEIRRLLSLRAGIAAGGMRTLWIRGEPGVGKSALVDALRPKLVVYGGYLASGHFAQTRDRPYDGWISVLESIVQQLLIESDARLESWRSRLREELGGIGAALVELAPDVQFVLGDVPALPPLGAREAQARLSLALQRFIGACATPAHPLLIFVDDLQWADAESRSLLEDLLCGEATSNVLVIGAYRASEVGPNHAVTAMLARLTQRGLLHDSIDLRPLTPAAVSAWLSDVLERRPASAVLPLVDLVERKTGNSPELVRQFIEHLSSRGLLRYRRGEGWTWDEQEVAAADVPDGAAALMTTRLERLEGELRALIQLASCAGDEFDTEHLCALTQRNVAVLEQQLYSLCETGLIAPCPRGFRFVHHRIREAAQAQLAPDTRARLHHDMAVLLLERIPEAERAQHVFRIVEHLNQGRAYVPESLRGTAVRLNMLAAKRALDAGAAETAETHFSAARELVREEDWEQEHALGFELLLASADVAILLGNFTIATERLDELEHRSPTLLESAHVAVRRIQIQAVTLHPEECARSALELLQRFGIRWPLRPSRWRATLAVLSVQWRFWRRGQRPLLQPATTVAPDRLAATLIVGIVGGILARIDFHLGVLANTWVLSSNFRHGYLKRPGYTLAVYAGSVRVLIAQDAAKRVVALASEWNDREPDPVYQLRTRLQIQALIQPWWTRRRQALAPLEEISERMLEVGDVEYAYYARFLKIVYGALAGAPVESSEQELLKLAENVQRSRHRYPEPDRCHRVYRLLRTSGDDVASELAQSDQWIADNRGSAEPYLRTLWLMVLCVHGHHALAFEQSETLGARLFKVVPYVHVADHTFYRGVAAAALARTARGNERRRYLAELRTCHRWLRHWAMAGTDFVHMMTLLGAELSSLRGRRDDARNAYLQAARLARHYDYLHHAALAHELHAGSLRHERRETEAAAALRDAIALYTTWGAVLKAAALMEQHDRLTGAR